MGIGDDVKHNAEEMKGKAKEKFGEATDDQSLENEGKADQAKANLKQAGDDVKDAFTDDR
ncbi:CsbD family protein [Microbacterium sp. HD4P20]|uniref:CsbD family protein n=1 Tax=Microbacterium sp. HD4P20 TaxID=2864874 RepID=UPI001C63ED35|nr:CsbD family protein [Microbacterium sp. HD4P20]MCP2638265.1 CsbD family protein [Microbacterium sp. HD4P20]